MNEYVNGFDEKYDNIDKYIKDKLLSESNYRLILVNPILCENVHKEHDNFDNYLSKQKSKFINDINKINDLSEKKKYYKQILENINNNEYSNKNSKNYVNLIIERLENEQLNNLLDTNSEIPKSLDKTNK